MNKNKEKAYSTNMITKSDPININSISSNNSLINKFQICVGKLNDNSTKEKAFIEAISKSKNSPTDKNFNKTRDNLNKSLFLQ